MGDTLRNSFPPQGAVMAIAHVARHATPPDLLSRAVLAGHILRALSRQETLRGRIDPNSFFSVKELGERLNYFRALPRAGSGRPETSDLAQEFMGRAYRVFADTTRIAAIERERNSVADIGLRFLLQLTMDDGKSKASHLYPLYATETFLTLGVAREVLRDINLETKDACRRNITDKIEFEPLNEINRFHTDNSRKLPYYLKTREADPEKVNDAVIHLADLADKLQRFSNRMYQYAHELPHPRFRSHEGVSVLMLRDYLKPYKDARDAVIHAQKKAPGSEATVLEFAPVKKRGDGIIRKTPVIPAP